MRRTRDPFDESMTSLIDLAFNLLLFFVISLVIVPEDLVPLKLPTNFGEGQPDLKVGDEIIFHVLRSGAVVVEDQLLADSTVLDSLLFARADTLLSQFHASKPQGKVILKADSGAVWDRPIQLMQAAGKQGVPISIALTPDVGSPAAIP
ncbi:biopolymer transporter ExbD [candidate division KSB1 bacterium]|nr:biopolymer transporter ExbD [candidate division KSB1 bacterium]